MRDMVVKKIMSMPLGEDKEQRFEFLIPYGTYLKEQTRKYKNDIKNAKNWQYIRGR